MIGSVSNRHIQGRWLLILAGTLVVALAGCEGPAGADGVNGKDGIDGQNGADGQDGQNGQDGTPGTPGQNGQNGQDGQDGEQGPQGPAGPSTWLSAPGVTLNITGAELTPERKVVIGWTITDSKNQPLDRAGRVTEGAYNPSFVVAYLDPATNQFVSLKTKTETAGDVNATQATSDSGGTTADISVGTYEYTTGLAVPADLPANTTLRVFGYADRAFQGVTYVGADTYDFTLDGSAPAVRQIVTDTACNKCHGALTAHGRRRGVDGCVTCHTMQSTDAQTGNTVDLATMVHKIHTGVDLPSVNEGAAGTFYGISGYQNHLYKYAEKQADGTVTGVEFLRDIRSCDVCHGGAAQGDRKFTAMSKRACGSCHDGADATAHFVGKTDDMCTACHTNGFGSLPPIDEIHQSNLEWAKATGVTKGIVLQIVSVTGVAAGGTPTIQFTLKDATGANVAPSTMATLSANFGGPMPVPTWNLLGQSLKTATGPDANGVYTKTVGALPATVTAGETVIVELDDRISRTGTRDGASVTVTEVAPNAVAYVVAGTDAPGTPRAFDVPMASCNTCHGQIGDSPSLSGHGGQRNTMEACITCHNPTLTDAARRNDGTTPVSVDLPVMIHKIHAGETLSQGYVVFGYGNSRNDFSEIAFTRQLDDCKTCHVGNAWKEPSARACITCHDSPAAEAHAELNTTTAGVEACDVCHGAGSTLGADKIHTPVP